MSGLHFDTARPSNPQASEAEVGWRSLALACRSLRLKPRPSHWPAAFVVILTVALLTTLLAYSLQSTRTSSMSPGILSGVLEGSSQSAHAPSSPAPKQSTTLAFDLATPSNSVQSSTSYEVYHNLIGWDGNGTIYPTTDSTPYDLPAKGSFAFQTADNSSLGPGSGAGEVNTNLLNVTDTSGEVPMYGDFGGDDGPFLVWLYVAAEGGASQFDVFPDGCNDPANEFQAYGIDVAVTPNGLPSTSTNAFLDGNNTGFNTTKGNLGDFGSSAGQLLGALGFGLLIASLLFPEIAAITIGSVTVDLAEEQPDGPVSNGFVTSNPDVPGNQVANQVVGVKFGTGSFSNACMGESGGQNVFSTADWVEEVVPGSTLSTLMAGSIVVSSTTVLEFNDSYSPSSSEVAAGANTSVSYPIEPAASLGGHVRLFSSPSCSPNCPVVPNSTVTITQDLGTGPAEVENYTESAASSGYWHFFAETGSEVTGTSYQATWSDPLGTVVSTRYAASTQEGSDNETLDPVLNGGQVYGDVLGYESGTPRGISGANVQLCNNNGCVSATSGQGGAYAIDYPIAGTTSDPYQITFSRPGWPTTTQRSLDLTVGSPTEKNLFFTPQYNVTYSESNLTSGKSWCVTLESVEQTCASSPASITFAEPNGSYVYDVQSPAGWGADPGTGEFTLDGSSDSFMVHFSTVPGSVYFNETGLPSGYRWNVTLGSGGATSTGSSIEFTEPQGSYRFTVQGPVVHSGSRIITWYPSPASGTVTLSGSAVTEDVSFTEKANVIVGDQAPFASPRLLVTLIGSPSVLVLANAVLLASAVLWIWGPARRKGGPL